MGLHCRGFSTLIESNPRVTLSECEKYSENT